MQIEQEENLLDYNRNIKFENITLKNLNFNYQKRKSVLKKINLQIKKGQKIAIIGESGCGKTTIAKLLLKIFKFENNALFIDNIDINRISCSFIRRNIAYVNQESFFFTDTVYNNLVLNQKNIELDIVKEICEKCNIHDFISALPLG